MAYETTVKYLRAHSARVTDGGLNSVMMYHMKLLYEFWGFCINGSNDLRIPGGMPTASSSYLSVSLGFESGSSVLLASGSDGSTTYGDLTFTAPSINWTSGSLVGKHIVTWKSSSSSTDDSIYRIDRVISSSSVMLSVMNGGTPTTGTLTPRFETRSSINFRVIDLRAASFMSSSAGAYMIFQMNASAVNVGQRNSQAKLTLRAGNSSISSMGISLSPSGTLTDLTPELIPDGSTETGGVGFGTYDWFNGSAGSGSISMWADQASLIMHTKGTWNTNGSFMHIEVPTRLFPAEKDPNPICCMNVGKRGITAVNIDTTRSEHFSAGWVMGNPFDNSTLRRWVALIRSVVGAYFDTNQFTSGDGGVLASSRFKDTYYNHRTKKHLVLNVFLANRQTANSYSIGRVKLRRAAFIHESYPRDSKIGGVGSQWIHVGAGVLWPWDNAVLPHSILAMGD